MPSDNPLKIPLAFDSEDLHSQYHGFQEGNKLGYLNIFLVHSDQIYA